MSCFTCEDETISRAVAVLLPLDEAPSAEALDALGQEILELNQAAYKSRYPGETFAPEKFRFVSSEALGQKPIQMLKSLQCVIYQCSEGNIPDTSALYDRMTKAERAMMGKIIEALPEYGKAKWG